MNNPFKTDKLAAAFALAALALLTKSGLIAENTPPDKALELTESAVSTLREEAKLFAVIIEDARRLGFNAVSFTEYRAELAAFVKDYKTRTEELAERIKELGRLETEKAALQTHLAAALDAAQANAAPREPHTTGDSGDDEPDGEPVTIEALAAQIQKDSHGAIHKKMALTLATERLAQINA
jgi:hypothetical protein